MTWKPAQPATTWSISESTCATISAALTAVAVKAVGRKSKGKKASLARHAFDPAKEPGVMSPVGYWDPLALMHENNDPDSPLKSEETFRWYRAAELKHGRVCMTAMIGLVSGTFLKWPGFENVKSGFGALDSSLGGAGFGMLVLIAGICELDLLTQDPSKAPGDLGNPLITDEEEERELFTEELRNKELAHCRLAMSGILTCAILEYNGVSPETFLSLDYLPAFGKVALIFLFVAWTSFEDSQPKMALASGAAAPALPASKNSA